MRRISVLLLSLILLLNFVAAGSAADTTAGKAVYERLCLACHGPAGVGATGVPLNTASFAESYGTIAKLQAITRQGAPGMPAFGPEALKDADLENLLAYLLSLAPAGSAPAPTVAAATAPSQPAASAPAQPAAAPVLPLEQIYAIAVIVLATVNGVVMFVLWKLVNRRVSR